jgi:hypothetical protein
MDRPQAEHSADIPWDPSVKWAFPKEVHQFLEKYNWGDFHNVFHMSRHYYTMSPNGRAWLDQVGEPPAPFQEGDPNNGVEFLTMHRAMLEYLRQRFGSMPVNDPEGRKTLNEVFDGWRTDEDVARALQQQNGDSSVQEFRAGLATLNNFAGFKTEDEFGLFIQTAQRLVGTVSPHDPSARRYTTDRRPGAGVHNWLHGQFMDDNSPITVGDPRTNLPSILFWRIHGWIEAKWKAFEAVHRRSAEEEQLYQGFITLFRAHMVRMSDNAASAQAAALPGGDANGCSVALAQRVDCQQRDKNACVLAGCCWLPVARGPSCFKPDNTGVAGAGSGGAVPGTTQAPATTTTTRRPWWSRSLFNIHDDAKKVRRDVRNLENSADRADRSAQFQRMFFNMQESMKMRGRRRTKTPWSVVYDTRPYMFRNHIRDCAALVTGVVSDDCPQGNRGRGIPAKDDLRPGQIRSRRRAAQRAPRRG